MDSTSDESFQSVFGRCLLSQSLPSADTTARHLPGHHRLSLEPLRVVLSGRLVHTVDGKALSSALGQLLQERLGVLEHRAFYGAR